MENQTEKKEIEIDLKQLVGELFKRIWIILIVTAIAAVAALIISMFFITPVYSSVTRVYILSKQSETAVSYTDLQTATQLTSDYEQLIKSRYVLDTVIADLNLDTTAEALAGSVSVSSPTGTRMLEISVNSSDPYEAQKIADRVREIAGKQIVDIMSIDAVNVVDTANLPLSPSSPSVSRNTLIGALAGFILCCGAVILKYILNDTVRTPEDIENYLGLSVLGIIPISEEGDKKYGPNKQKQKKSRRAAQTRSA